MTLVGAVYVTTSRNLRRNIGELMESFDPADFISETADAYDIVDIVLNEGYIPFLESANLVYDGLDIAKMDVPLSVKEMMGVKQ